MSDEDDLEDFEPDQDDFEKEEDEKETEEGEDYRKEGEEFPEEWLPTPLTEDMMKEGLSLLCKTGSGLAHAYVKLEVKERDLTDIYLLRSYIHLRYVDVSENHLTDLSPLNYLTHLLWLKADGNQLRSAQLNELPYLQIASFAYNQITDTEGISHPRLETLNLKGGTLDYHTTCPRALAAQNMLKKVESLEDLSNLTTLHLRDNQIDTLSGFSREMKSLQYLNLRGNMVANLGELAKLRDLPKLRALVLLDNPCTEETNYRQEALVQMPYLERLDKEFYEEEERAEADEIRQSLKEDKEKEQEPEPERDLEPEQSLI
ncbi:PREDICTED: leucine-rich repeat-containing protein 23 [Colobus angolensis palliatus]|uniref:leucine-rich repeat-containing protein 23 n=1 Tax=Colobus angolensis palliatus TaxID=336983 RepID=UPI0005F380EA|nr:PREDICTED: leucine-rich repeat-containing protein 23 [Colobus angolensis palliatus]